MPLCVHWSSFVAIKRVSLLYYLTPFHALHGFKVELDLVQDIIKDYTHLINSGKTITLCWIPSHVNIEGNNRLTLRLNRLFP